MMSGKFFFFGEGDVMQKIFFLFFLYYIRRTDQAIIIKPRLPHRHNFWRNGEFVKIFFIKKFFVWRRGHFLRIVMRRVNMTRMHGDRCQTPSGCASASLTCRRRSFFVRANHNNANAACAAFFS